MYILPVPEGIYKVGVTAQMGHDTKLDLRIVRRHYHSAWPAGHKGLPYLLAPLCADRDILEIRLGGTEASGGRKSLIEGRMYLPCHRGHIGRERFYICGQQLLDTAVLQDFIDYRVLFSQACESVLVCRIAVSHPCLRLHLRVKLELLKDQSSYLTG